MEQCGPNTFWTWFSVHLEGLLKKVIIFKAKPLIFIDLSSVFCKNIIFICPPCAEIKTLNHHHKWLSVLSANLMTLLIEGAYQWIAVPIFYRAIRKNGEMIKERSQLLLRTARSALFVCRSGIFEIYALNQHNAYRRGNEKDWKPQAVMGHTTACRKGFSYWTSSNDSAVTMGCTFVQ